MKIAVPTQGAGGENAARSEHFGRAESYTVFEFDPEGNQLSVSVIMGLAHEEGGCGRPVELLAQAGVDVLVTAGMGMMPLRICAQRGIAVLRDMTSTTAAQAARAGLEGRLQPLDPSMACQH